MPLAIIFFSIDEAYTALFPASFFRCSISPIERGFWRSNKTHDGGKNEYRLCFWLKIQSARMCAGDSMVLDDICKNRAIDNNSWSSTGFEATEHLTSRVIASCGIVRGFRKYHLVLKNLLETSHLLGEFSCIYGKPDLLLGLWSKIFKNYGIANRELSLWDAFIYLNWTRTFQRCVRPFTPLLINSLEFYLIWLYGERVLRRYYSF